MHIAESHFQELLASDDPPAAVAELAGVWWPRARANADRPNFALSPPEYAAHLILVYTTEVSNGGHAQFFGNRGGGLIPDTLEALGAVGLPELRANLEGAVAHFPGGAVPLDPAAADAAVDALPASGRRAHMAADEAVYRVGESADARLLIYLRSHADEVLVPERE